MKMLFIAPFIGIRSKKSKIILSRLNINIGGAEISAELLCEELSKRGHDISIITSTLSPRKEKERLITYPILPPKFCAIAGKFIPIVYPPLTRIWKSIQADVIILQDNYSAGFFVKPPNIPIIPIIRDYWFSCPQKTLFHVPDKTICRMDSYKRCFTCYRAKKASFVLSHFSSALYQFVKLRIDNFFKNINGILFTSQSLMNVFRNRIRVLNPMFVTGNSFKIASDVRVAYRKPQFLFSGRFSDEKGIIPLLKAFKLYKKKGGSFKLKLIGEGPYLSLIRRLNSEIEYRPWMNQKDLYKEITSSSCSIITPSWREPFGRFQLESLLLGTPLIVPNYGEPKYFVEKTGAGIVLKKRNISAIASSMLKMENNIDHFISRAESEKDILQKEYSSTVVADKTASIVKTIVNTSKGIK
jgi:glycosyltransferase involved in cell wall biosynthesis